MAETTCGDVYLRGDDVLTCDLPAKHTDPTGALPQGSPHEDSEYLDDIDGDPKPWRWWG